MGRCTALLMVLTLVVASCSLSDEEGGEPSTAPSTITTSTSGTTTSTTPPATTMQAESGEPPDDGPLGVAEVPVGIQELLVSGETKAATAIRPIEEDESVTYLLPGAIDTHVGRVRYRSDVTLDLYFPPSYTFEEALPAVVFANGWSSTQNTVMIDENGQPMDEGFGTLDWQNSHSFTSMGNLVAASGLIGVVYGTVDDPYRDLDDVVKWLTSNATELGIDPSRTAVWMWSAHALTGLRVVMGEGNRQDNLAGAVVYYGWMPSDRVRDDLPVQVIRASEDLPFFIDSQARFFTEAEALGAPVEYAEIQGPHSFDREPGYEAATIETIDSTLRFLNEAFASTN